MNPLIDMGVIKEIRCILHSSPSSQEEPVVNREKDQLTTLLLPLIGENDVERLLSKIDVHGMENFSFAEFTDFFISSLQDDEWSNEFYRLKLMPLKANSTLHKSSSLSFDSKLMHSKPITSLIYVNGQIISGGEDGQLKAWSYRGSNISMNPLVLSYSCDHVKTNGLNTKDPDVQIPYKRGRSIHRHINEQAVAVTAMCAFPRSPHLCVGSVDCSLTVYDVSATQGFEVCSRLHDLRYLSSPPSALQSFQNVRSSDSGSHLDGAERADARIALSGSSETEQQQQQQSLYIAIGDLVGFMCIYEIDPKFGRKESKIGGQSAKVTKLLREGVRRARNKVVLTCSFSKEPYFRSRIHKGGITQTKFISALGLLLSSSDDGKLSFFDVSKREVVRSFNSNVGGIVCFTWWQPSHGQKNCISGSGRTLYVWNAFSFEAAGVDCEMSLSAPVVDVTVHSTSASRDQQLIIAACVDGKMNIYLADSFKRVQIASMVFQADPKSPFYPSTAATASVDISHGQNGIRIASNILLVPSLKQNSDAGGSSTQIGHGDGDGDKEESYSCVLFTPCGETGTRIQPWIFGWNQQENDRIGASVEPNAYTSEGPGTRSLPGKMHSRQTRADCVTEDNSLAASAVAGAASVSGDEIVSALCNTATAQAIVVFLRGAVDVFDCQTGLLIRRFCVGSTTSVATAQENPNPITVKCAALDTPQRRLLVAIHFGNVEVWNFHTGVLLQSFEPSLRSVFTVHGSDSLTEQLENDSSGVTKLRQRINEVSLVRETVSFIGFVQFPLPSPHVGKQYIAVGYASGLSCFFEFASGNRNNENVASTSFMSTATFSMCRQGHKVMFILDPNESTTESEADLQAGPDSTAARVLVGYEGHDSVYWAIPAACSRVSEHGNRVSQAVADDATLLGVKLLSSSHGYGVKVFGAVGSLHLATAGNEAIPITSILYRRSHSQHDQEDRSPKAAVGKTRHIIAKKSEASVVLHSIAKAKSDSHKHHLQNTHDEAAEGNEEKEDMAVPPPPSLELIMKSRRLLLSQMATPAGSDVSVIHSLAQMQKRKSRARSTSNTFISNGRLAHAARLLHTKQIAASTNIVALKCAPPETPYPPSAVVRRQDLGRRRAFGDPVAPTATVTIPTEDNHVAGSGKDNVSPVTSLVTCAVSLCGPSNQDQISVIIGACCDRYFRIWTRHVRSVHGCIEGGDLLCSLHYAARDPVEDDDEDEEEGHGAAVITSLAVDGTTGFIVGGFDSGELGLWKINYDSIRALVGLQCEYPLLFQRRSQDLSRRMATAASRADMGRQKDETDDLISASPTLARIVRSGLNDVTAVKSSLARNSVAMFEVASSPSSRAVDKVSGLGPEVVSLNGELFTEISKARMSGLGLGGRGGLLGEAYSGTHPAAAGFAPNPKRISASFSHTQGQEYEHRSPGLLMDISGHSPRRALSLDVRPSQAAPASASTNSSLLRASRASGPRVKWRAQIEWGGEDDRDDGPELESGELRAAQKVQATVHDEEDVIRRHTALLAAPLDLALRWEAHDSAVLSVGLMDLRRAGKSPENDLESDSLGIDVHVVHVLSSAKDQSVALWATEEGRSGAVLVGRFGCHLWSDVNTGESNAPISPVGKIIVGKAVATRSLAMATPRLLSPDLPSASESFGMACGGRKLSRIEELNKYTVSLKQLVWNKRPIVYKHHAAFFDVMDKYPIQNLLECQKGGGHEPNHLTF